MGSGTLGSMNNYSEIIHDIFGNNIEITGSRPVSGGDINEAFRLFLSDGNTIFLKENSKKNASFFKAEETGLAAIRKTGGICVSY